MHIDGPYFDDFVVGETLPPAPPITIGVGEPALYQAIAGDPYALALSRPLVHTVTGDPRPSAHPADRMDPRSTRRTDRLGDRRGTPRPDARFGDRCARAGAPHTEPGGGPSRSSARPTRAAIGLRRPHHRVGASLAGAPAAVAGSRHPLARL